MRRFPKTCHNLFCLTFFHLTLSLFFLSGCGGESEPPESASSSTKSTIEAQQPIEEQTSKPLLTARQTVTQARPTLKLPSTDLTETSEPIETEAPAPVKEVQFEQEHVEAFDKLVTPANSIEAWEQANQTVLQFGEKIVPLLADRLKNGNNIERETAASTLISFGPDAEAAIPELRLALKDPVPFVQANAAVTLVQFPEEASLAVPVLVTFLEHNDPTLQQMAAMNLSFLGEDASPHVADLTRVLESSDGPELILPVVQLLGRIGPAAETAVPKLKQIAFEQKGELGEAATSAIQLIKTNSE